MTDRHWHPAKAVPGGLVWEHDTDDPGGFDIAEMFCQLDPDDEDVLAATAALVQCVATLAEARRLAAALRPLVYARNPDKVDALLDLLSGVPVGGGEPLPTTSTDTEPVPAGTDCEAPDPDGITYGCRRPPGHDGSHQGYYRVDGRPLYWRKRDVRSAGGGDQPDTPCPECEGIGRVHPFPFMAPGDPTVPCPACPQAQP